MPQKPGPPASAPVSESSRGALAFDKTLDRGKPTGQTSDADAAGLSDAALAVTQDASQPLRPKVIVSSPGESEDGDDDGDAQTLDVGAPIPSHRAATDPADADEEDTGSTRSVGAVRSGVAMSAPRSAPSVPYVGIPRSLQKWDRYEVQAVLGAGGMGAVYRARDPRLSRMVALKIIHPMLGQEDDTHGQGVVRRFLREARLQASLEHPHICKVYEIGELPTADGEASHPYICMQLISGRPLHRAQAEMSLFEKVRVIQQVAEALHTAHKQGLIHRDIKPSNIMVERTPEGGFHPYVMDFGLARETSGDQSRSGIIEGTPRYMAPEQARGDTKHLDRRTDVYALGVTLYELLVGRAPYETQGDMDTLLAVIAAEPTPLRRIDGEIPTDLEAVTLKCLEKEQSARYDSAKALAEDLGRYLDGEPVQARHIGLGQRLLRRARKHKPLVALAAALFLSLLGLVAYGTRVRIVAAERERAAEEQAKIAQVVGQQIGEMEWLLRSARQLPLHDLGREKQKVRERMKGLQRELGQRAGVTEGALHYALGRGHLALHEYDAALSELEASVSRGHGGPEVHYALGLVLGKLYERGMYEVRLSGSGEWAEKQRRGLVPKYLEPAIASLQRSRAQKVDAPRYLEAQIKYYQGDYEGARQEAEAAYGDAGWLYEALKLQGDIGYERALRARDSGKYEEAEKEFGNAVRKYEEASRIGASDSEVYEGLAEAWVRQIEMAMQRGQSPEEAYRRAKEASERASEAERERVVGKLKRGYAALMTMATLGSGQSTAERVKECMSATEGVLEAEPDNPYARDVAAGCYAFSADAAQARGEDPEPLYRKAIGLLEPAVKKHPHFLWGLNDLANLYIAMGAYLQARGQGNPEPLLQNGIDYEQMAIDMDATYNMAYANRLYARSRIMNNLVDEMTRKDLLSESDRDYGRCIEVNKEFPLCHVNYILVYGRASERAELAGGEVGGLVERVERARAALGKAGEGMLDVWQYTALAQLSQARWEVKEKRKAGDALARHEEAVKRCLGVSVKDAMCRALWAQSEWVRAEVAVGVEGEVWKVLKEAERKAREATESPEVNGESWWTLAETQRLEREQAKSESEKAGYGRAVRESLKGCYRVNAGHGRCHGTAGLVALSEAREAKEAAGQRERAAEAVRELEAAVRSDGLLLRVYGGALTEAQNLARSAARVSAGDAGGQR